MDKLGNILPRVVRRQPGGHRILEHQIAAAFREMIGPEPARLCESVELRAGVLWVNTSSPALAHQLRLEAATIVKRLDEMDMGRRVRDLKVRIGRSTPG